jgi:tRNA A-37 threonylcarbamoyl transferase component Bud32
MTPVRSDADLPAVFAPVLRRLRQEAGLLCGAPEVRVTPAAYQARLFSNVLRVRLTTPDDTHLGYWFAKIQIPKDVPDGVARLRARVLHEHDTTAKVERALTEFGDLPALHSIACYPDLFTIVTQEVPGVTLFRYLETRLSWLSNTAARAEAERAAGLAGAWVRRFQTVDPSSAVLDVDLRAYIDLRLQRLESSPLSPITAPMRARVLAHVEALAAAVPMNERRNVIVHADLAPGNVMVTDRGVAVLDFAMASRGSYVQDITRLALQIDLLRGKPQFAPHAVRRVVHALLAGFDPGMSGKGALFRLFTLRHRINHLGTLTLNRGKGARRLYNWRLRHMHERAIATELATAIADPGAAHLDAAPEH